jgi:hypothetical protein
MTSKPDIVPIQPNFPPHSKDIKLDELLKLVHDICTYFRQQAVVITTTKPEIIQDAISSHLTLYQIHHLNTMQGVWRSLNESIMNWFRNKSGINEEFLQILNLQKLYLDRTLGIIQLLALSRFVQNPRVDPVSLKFSFEDGEKKYFPIPLAYQLFIKELKGCGGQPPRFGSSKSLTAIYEDSSPKTILNLIQDKENKVYNISPPTRCKCTCHISSDFVCGCQFPNYNKNGKRRNTSNLISGESTKTRHFTDVTINDEVPSAESPATTDLDIAKILLDLRSTHSCLDKEGFKSTCSHLDLSDFQHSHVYTSE